MVHPFIYTSLLFIFILNNAQQTILKECKVTSTCRVSCSGTYNADWGHQIKQIAEQNACEIITLEISSGEFPSKLLPSDWLNAIKQVSIDSLIFSACDFERIEPNALKDIKGLHNLYFKQGSLNYFEKSFFGGLPELTHFQLENISGKLKGEAKFLENARQIEILSIVQCRFDAQFISNITGSEGSNLSELQMIDLRFNSIPKLTDLMFSKATKLRSLYLINSGIEMISMKAFWSQNIQLIHLNNNYLSILENGTFEYIKHEKWMNRTLVLDSNPWNCNCHLKWLQDLYNSPERVFITPEPRCDTSEGFSEANFRCDTTEGATESTGTITTTVSSTIEVSTSEVSSTGGSSTTEELEITTTTTELSVPSSEDSSEPTITTIEIPTTTLTNEHMQIKCINAANKKFTGLNIASNDVLQGSIFINVTIGDKTVSKVQVHNCDYDSLLKLYFEGTPNKFNLVYFESFKPDSAECVGRILNNFVELEYLNPNKTYTFCVVLEDELKVPPTSCFGIHIPPNWEDRGWIKNENRLIILICLPIVFIVNGMISAVVAFCVIRRFPKLIEGNKDVIILKRSKRCSALPQKIVEPKEVEETEYAEPVAINHLQSGYLTPACPKYEKVNDCGGTNSIYCAKSQSYIRPGFSTISSQYSRGPKGISELNESTNSNNYEKVY